MLGRRTERALTIITDAILETGAFATSTVHALAQSHSSILLRARTLAREKAPVAVEAHGGAWEYIAEATDARAADAAARSFAEHYLDALNEEDVAEALKPAIRRASYTEVWEAANDETRLAAESAAAHGTDLWLVWSALSDACPRCRDRHDERVHVSVGFADWPPLHPHCKCLVLTEDE